MTTQSRTRRHERHTVETGLMLRITDPVVEQEVVRTVDISSHGARVLSRHQWPADARGTARSIENRREAPCRIVWQSKRPDDNGYYETGIEIGLEPGTRAFLFEVTETVAAPSLHAFAAPQPVAQSDDLSMLSEALSQARAAEGEEMLERLCTGIVELLESKGLIKRADLIATLRRLEGSNTAAKTD